MDSQQHNDDALIIERVLNETARFYAFPDKFQTQTVFDRAGGHFLLLDEGWSGYERVHRVWVHVDLRGDGVWVQEDRTQDGITHHLVAAGIPKERIVLAFQHPARRD